MEFYDQNINGKIEISNLSLGLKIFVLLQKLLLDDELSEHRILNFDGISGKFCVRNNEIVKIVRRWTP